MSFWGRIFGLRSNPEYERGIRYYNDGEYELAIEQLEKATESIAHDDPTYALGMFYAAEAHVHIGTARYFTGDFEQALEHFEKAVTENPTYPDLYYRMGVIYHKKDRIESSVDMLKKAIKLNSRYFEAVCYLGIVLLEKGEAEAADRQFQIALELSSDKTPSISKFLSDHLSSNKTDIPPLKELKKIITSSSRFDTLVRDGVEQYNTGNYSAAVDTFTELREMHPDYADIRFKLGLALFKNSEGDKAFTELEEALKINPDYSEARYYLGILLFDQKRYSEAVLHLKRAAEEKQNYPDIQCYYGATLLYLGKYGKAREVLENVIEIAPEYCRARYYYGFLLNIMGERKLAIENLKMGMEKSERKGVNDINLAILQIRERDLEGAMLTLRTIMEAGVESADVYYFIAEVYLNTGRMEKAEEYFRKAVEVNDKYLRAREKLAHILVEKGNFEEAEEVLGSNDGDFADIYKIMGDIQYYRHNYDKAEEYYSRSLEINSEYTDVLISLSIVLRNKGENERAQEILMNVLKYEPDNLAARNLLGEGPLNIDNL
ncbi:MAG: tetratricopeptide repeat protein [Candidatus Latescibacteria bacterium]|nr:tetratricopeptide repeat protein [bacterium]MBD3423627.1 tetratricopeptide repeat protein [Candidatus Latescibacterota bacterium]